MYMKLRMILLAILTVVSSAVLAYSPLPRSLEGSMMPYDFSLVQEPEWPDSLKPRYCAYVARHGARYMTGTKKFKALRNALQECALSGEITGEGEAFLALIDTICARSDGHWGELSPVGLAEERRLGEQMLRWFPGLRTDKATASSISTFVPRAIMTMYMFSHSLSLGNSDISLSAASGHRYSPLLYFFAGDNAYARFRNDDASVKEIVQRMEKDSVSLMPLQRLTGKNYLHRIGDHQARKLVMEIYSVLQSLSAMGLPAPDTRWMTTAEYRGCWAVSNLTHYLRNNVNPLISNAVAESVDPLVSTIINKADSAAATNVVIPRLDGYFGHAETLLPLLSVIGIPGCYAMPLDYDNLQDTWKLQEITPLGANLAVFLLDSPSGTIYAAVRLNGRNIKPLQGEGLIVKWRDLADYWTHRVNALSSGNRE